MSRDTLYQQAFEAFRQNRPDIAGRLTTKILADHPDDPGALLLKGVTHSKAESVIGLALTERATYLAPDNAQNWYNLGVFEGERGALEKALYCYQRAIALDPGHIDALNNGSELMRRFERFDQALHWAERQLAIAPTNWPPLLNKAVSLFYMRREKEAEAAFRAALAIEPDRSIISWEFSHLLLLQKRFEEAWQCFEHRFACGHLSGVFAYPFSQRRWTGDSLEGRHLLVHNEQGLGDQIMFATALSEVVERAGKVTLVVAPELEELFRSSFPEVRVLPAYYGRFAGDNPRPPWISELIDVDYQIPVGSLMALLRNSEQPFQKPKPYMKCARSTAAKWRDWAEREMPKSSGMRVGLAWASSPALFRDETRRRAVRKSMALADMAPLAKVAGVQFVGVLNWPVPEIPGPLASGLKDVSAKLTSFEETAGLLSTLDMVITVDTAVAHLAGAMGKAVILLLHDFADSRWTLTDRKSYWYPDVRLVRQDKAGDWKSVIARVTKELQASVESGRRLRTVSRV